MNNLVNLGITLAAMFIIAGEATAQTNALEERKERARIYDGTKRSIQMLDNLVRPELTRKEQKIFDEIRTRVPRSPNIAPSASKIGELRIISISTGVTVFSEHMAYALHMSAGNGGDVSCWLSFLKDTWIKSEEQRGSRSRNENRNRGFNFFSFASTNPECQRSELLSSYSVSEEVRSTVEAAIAFFYLHEMAHHVLGHLDGPRDESSNLMREIAADSWAVDQMLKVEVYPINATGALIPYILYNPTTTSHPPFSRRLTSIYEKMAEWLKSSDKPWAGDEAAQEAMAMRDHFIRVTRELDY